MMCPVCVEYIWMFPALSSFDISRIPVFPVTSSVSYVLSRCAMTAKCLVLGLCVCGCLYKCMLLSCGVRKHVESDGISLFFCCVMASADVHGFKSVSMQKLHK